MAEARVRILYFAWLRERVGVAEEALALPANVGTLGALIDWLRSLDERHASALADPRLVRAAVNQDFADRDAPLRAGDEVAFFPPVTGG
jgi:molybdopterin synthase sulfur carrier subunit